MKKSIKSIKDTLLVPVGTHRYRPLRDLAEFDPAYLLYLYNSGYLDNFDRQRNWVEKRIKKLTWIAQKLREEESKKTVYHFDRLCRGVF